MAVELVPRLDKAGEKKAAEEVFEKVWAFNAALVKEYPKSVRHHQRLAILAVKCGRHEAEGKEHAEVAVRLDPEDEGFRKVVGK